MVGSSRLEVLEAFELRGNVMFDVSYLNYLTIPGLPPPVETAVYSATPSKLLEYSNNTLYPN